MKALESKIPQWHSLVFGTICFVVSISAGIIVISLLNGSWVNHGLTPFIQFLSLFQLLWNDNPPEALWFLIKKSLFSLAHKDPRSGLNLWTYEFSSLSLLLYIAVAVFTGRLLARLGQEQKTLRQAGKILIIFSIGAVLALISMSYMTSIEHCSGATWVGFVALYGLGVDGFSLYTAWQWLLALIGAALMAWSKHIEQNNT